MDQAACNAYQVRPARKKLRNSRRSLQASCPKISPRMSRSGRTTDKAIATRVAGGKSSTLSRSAYHNIVGGQADLGRSTNTARKGMGDFRPANAGLATIWNAVSGEFAHSGHNTAFGVREHAMGAAVNGMAAHGGILPFGATFLVFSDYMKPAIRLSALSKLRSIWVFTHDSIGVGEDGPTHEPVEQTGRPPCNPLS